MSDRTVRILLAYDGTEFSGWQVQDQERTVQGELMKALGVIHDRETGVNGAGRTDAGVHARGQVANFDTSHSGIEDYRFAAALNANLPHDVRVLSSACAPRGFDSRRWALWRAYEYFLYPCEIGFPDVRRYCWGLRRTPRIAQLNRIASALVGEHDFSTFTASGDVSSSRVREVLSASFSARPPFVVFRIVGNAFLRKMVRSVVGTIVQIESEGGGREEMLNRLKSGQRDAAGPTAPARGLFLAEVGYGAI